MKKIVYISLFLTAAIFAQDMRNNAFSSLFSDHKAVRIGDAVTILVMESSKASNSADKSTGRASDLAFGFDGAMDQTSLPGVDVGVSSSNDFRGSGSTKTSGMVQTKIAATIDSVLANGNLRINGSRKITINGEEQRIFIKGIVRVSDISSDNQVYSYDISDAEIVFEGEGMIESNQNPGWLTRFFHWIF